MDAATEESIIGVLKSLRDEGKSVVCVHHDLSTVAGYFDRVLLLNRRVLAEACTGLANVSAEFLDETVSPRFSTYCRFGSLAAPLTRSCPGARGPSLFHILSQIPAVAAHGFGPAGENVFFDEDGIVELATSQARLFQELAAQQPDTEWVFQYSPEMFSGLVWTGEKSVELGLADALGSTEYVAREVIKAEKLVNFTPEENVFEDPNQPYIAAVAMPIRSLCFVAAAVRKRAKNCAWPAVDPCFIGYWPPRRGRAASPVRRSSGDRRRGRSAGINRATSDTACPAGRLESRR